MVERIELLVNGLRREYLLVPSPRKASPVVLFLHGMGATASWADEETGWSQLAVRKGFTLVLPEAMSANPDRPPRFLTNPQRWNDGCPTSGHVEAVADDVAFIGRVIDDVRTRLPIDPARVFLSGFSNGAAMAFRAATELSDRIAAVAPVAGYRWVPHPLLARPIPTNYLIGSHDPLVPMRGGDVRSPWQHRYVRRPPVSDTLERWARFARLRDCPTNRVRQRRRSGRELSGAGAVRGRDDRWPGPSLGRWKRAIQSAHRRPAVGSD